MRARLIDQEDGDQIVVLPPGFELPGAEVMIVQDGDRLILSPLTEEAAS
ncbi:MAG: hypothetical protein Q8Q88_24455 [Phenylobacterium sp.]|nr:hypothetical protein [Phenylobacterium sp.]MDP3750191.1 hypothetical protein [Phenylobacterium sp.]